MSSGSNSSSWTGGLSYINVSTIDPFELPNETLKTQMTTHYSKKTDTRDNSSSVVIFSFCFYVGTYVRKNNDVNKKKQYI